MNKVLFLIVAMFGVSLGAVNNWNGYNDTLNVHGFKGTSTSYTGVLSFTDYEDIAVVVMANDTDAAGFANDSISFSYGYQMGYLVYNSSGVRDTLWWPSAGTLLDTITSPTTCDTSVVSGWAAQANTWDCPWGPVIRFQVTGLAANNKANPLKCRIAVLRRLYSETR
jgi:hypothetical protein